MEKVEDWMAWRCRVMTFLKQHIRAGTTWQLMDGGSQALEDFSPHVIMLMMAKAAALHSFGRTCRRRVR